MSTKSRARKRHPERRTTLPVFPVLIGVVVVLAVVAIVLAAGGGGDDGGDTDIAQTREVQIDGDALPAAEAGTLPESDPALGTVAPTLTGSDFSGNTVTVGDDGRAKAIFFLAHWCPHCRAELPRLKAWLDANELPDNVDLYLVPTSTASEQVNYPPSEWFEREGVAAVPTLVDDDRGSAHVAYGGGNFPYLVLLDSSHEVAARLSGEFPEDIDAYGQMFRALSAGEPVRDPRVD